MRTLAQSRTHRGKILSIAKVETDLAVVHHASLKLLRATFVLCRGWILQRPVRGSLQRSVMADFEYNQQFHPRHCREQPESHPGLRVAIWAAHANILACEWSYPFYQHS